MPADELLEAAVNLAGTQAQLTNAPHLQICLNNKERVVFDTILKESEDIRYEKKTGIFKITTPGTYLVNWSVAVNGSHTSPYIRFALETDGEVYGPSACPVSLGVIGGTGLVTVLRVPSTLSLINDTGDVACLAQVMPAAGITITKAIGNFSGRSTEEAIAGLIHSIALEEKALSHILFAEAQKILAATNMPGVTIKELLCINNSVESTLESITRLESFLAAKLKAALKHGKEC
jgi:hypothetical protein